MFIKVCQFIKNYSLWKKREDTYISANAKHADACRILAQARRVPWERRVGTKAVSLIFLNNLV